MQISPSSSPHLIFQLFNSSFRSFLARFSDETFNSLVFPPFHARCSDFLPFHTSISASLIEFHVTRCSTFVFVPLFARVSLDFSISFPFWFLHYSAGISRRFCLSTAELNWAKLSARLKCEKRDRNCFVNFCLTLAVLRKRLSDFDNDRGRRNARN